VTNSGLRAAADRLRERRQAKVASVFSNNQMFVHPVVGDSPSMSKRAGIGAGAVVGGISGAHGAVSAGGGVGSAAAGGLVGSLVGDAVFVTLAKTLAHGDQETRKMAVPLAMLASIIAGQVSGSVTKKWLLGETKKEKRDA